MKKSILMSSIAVLCIATGVYAVGFVSGGTNTTPSVYTVHITALDFAKAGGGVTPFHSGASDFDIAAAAANGTVGNYGSGVAITPGTYSGMRFTMGRSMTVRASGVDDASQTCHTAAGLGTVSYGGLTISLGSTDSSVATTSQEISIPVGDSVTQALEQGGINILSDGSLQGTLNFSNGNKTITDSNTPVKLLFNVTNAVELKDIGGGRCIILPNAPSLAVE